MDGKAVRYGDWKLVASSSPRISGHGEWELYNMRVDKTETQDLSQEKPDVVTELAALYEQWWSDQPAEYRNTKASGW